MAKQKRTIIPLTTFVQVEKRSTCKVCKLPVEVRGQIGRPASEKKIPAETQLRWIKQVMGVTITVEELRSHVTGRHDGAV